MNLRLWRFLAVATRDPRSSLFPTGPFRPSDLTFDFLWWTDAAYETEREGETVHGQTCMVILVRPPEKIAGLDAIRLWADKKTGCLMQAEQLGDGMKPIRRLWGTRVKKFGERWMVSVLEVETLGSRHRTKITVEDLKEL